MKKQNIVLIALFILLIVIFGLLSCIEDEKVIEEISEEEIQNSNYITVTLKGELERTGNFSVPADWNLFELFTYSGIKEESDISSFELSSLVEEGKVYYVKKISDNGVSVSEKVNINTADVDELSKINGIGEALALKIIAYRQQSPFTSIEDIKNVSGIGDATYEKIKGFITV